MKIAITWTAIGLVALGAQSALAGGQGACAIGKDMPFKTVDEKPSQKFNGETANLRIVIQVKAGAVDISGYRIRPNKQFLKTETADAGEAATFEFPGIQALFISPKDVESSYRYRICKY